LKKVDFKPLELWCEDADSLSNLARYISAGELYRLDELKQPQLVASPEEKKEAIALLKHWEKRGITDVNWDGSMADNILEMQRERWLGGFVGQFGLRESENIWRSDHEGYHLIQVLLVNAGLLTEDQMRHIKKNPGAHFPSNLYSDLHGLGVSADDKTIRRHIVNAAQTIPG